MAALKSDKGRLVLDFVWQGVRCREYLGQSENGRLLFVVYDTRPGGRIRVITARAMTEAEKRLWRRRRTKGRR